MSITHDPNTLELDDLTVEQAMFLGRCYVEQGRYFTENVHRDDPALIEIQKRFVRRCRGVGLRRPHIQQFLKLARKKYLLPCKAKAPRAYTEDEVPA